MTTTPRALGFRMPAEWEPHEATWLSWPHKEESWPGAFEPVAGVFAEIARHLASSELVRINVADEHLCDARQALARVRPAVRNPHRYFPPPEELKSLAG